MYGGVAQTYRLYKLDGEPFKENNALYIYVIHPITKSRKRVRWYKDAAHAALMPNTPTPTPLYKVFGFSSEDDSILAIREKDLTKEEVADYFSYKWQFADLFGGVWFTSKTSTKPPIKFQGKYFYPTWQEFKTQHELHLKKIKAQ